MAQRPMHCIAMHEIIKSNFRFKHDVYSLVHDLVSNIGLPELLALYIHHKAVFSRLLAETAHKVLGGQTKSKYCPKQCAGDKRDPNYVQDKVLRWQTDQILLQTTLGGQKSKYCPKQYAEGERDPNIALNSTLRKDTPNIARKKSQRVEEIQILS